MITRKKIPDGQSNFETIRTDNYIYVDKTRFIELIENEENRFNFLIRSRKFGKSLFLSMLYHYYDICSKDNFEKLFGDLYIGKNPTPKRNDMFVLKLNFSALDTSSIKDFNISLLEKMKLATQNFFVNHKNFFPNYKELDSRIWDMEKTSTCLELVFKEVNNFGKKVYVIIDEYDHFANDMIACGTYLGEDIYKKTVWAGSQIRDLYETLKIASETIIDNIFITGITPIMLDDLTSGFNISNNLSLKEKYNEILGFTKEEVEFVIQEAGIDKSLIKVDMEYLFDGYSFHIDAKNKLYNPAMINWFLMTVRDEGLKIDNLINLNLKTDYGRLRNLLNTENVKSLEELIEFGKIQAGVVPRFSIDKIHEEKNFLSLIYYMGLVTIDSDRGMPILKIPNYSIKTMYWEYMENLIMERNPEMSYNPSVIYSDLVKLGLDNEYEPFFKSFHKNFVSQVSNRDLENFSEKNIKFLLLSILFQNNIYLPISETENSRGYSDIYLQRRTRYPQIKIDWVWEIKYIKQKDIRKKNLIEAAKKEAIEQLERYKNSNLFKDRTDVRYVYVVFVGKKNYIIEEI